MNVERESISILLVDDHPMILEGYKNTISEINMEGYDFIIDTATDCDTAWAKIKRETYQIVFLDINFKVKPESRFLSGEDLGMAIRNHYPGLKIIILTVLEDALRIQNLLLNIAPEGFLLKGETNSEELTWCLERALLNPPYYSANISSFLLSRLKYTPLIDAADREILHHLSLGTKTKDLPQYVYLSLRSIEGRKQRLKEIFGVSGLDDRALLEKAKESGYI